MEEKKQGSNKFEVFVANQLSGFGYSDFEAFCAGIVAGAFIERSSSPFPLLYPADRSSNPSAYNPEEIVAAGVVLVEMMKMSLRQDSEHIAANPEHLKLRHSAIAVIMDLAKKKMSVNS